MPSDFIRVVAPSEIESHGVENAFPRNTGNMKTDETFFWVHRNFGDPKNINVDSISPCLSYRYGTLSPSSLHPRCEVMSRNLSALANSS